MKDSSKLTPGLKRDMMRIEVRGRPKTLITEP